MATTYLSNRAKLGNFSVGVGDTGPAIVPFTFTIPAVGFIINDALKLALIPANSVLCGFFISCPNYDIGGLHAGRFGLGDSTSTTLFASASTSGSSAAFDLYHNAISGFVAGALPKAYTAEDWLLMTFTTAPSTSVVSGTIAGFIMYNLNPGNLT